MTEPRKQKIEALQHRLAKLQAEQRAVEARARAAASKAARKKHTRKLVLIGATMQAMIERGEWADAELLVILDRYLQRADDRELFGLAPHVAVTPTASSSDSALVAVGFALEAQGGAS
ncbi:mobilization protein [Paracidovorax konjaci]|uniref:mobilization protein n=1 Tax=Paracidovorax konjaci TaxID=32040 RepID=UPI001113A7DF|nr:mobilization protein [Paracidovorax konjaci]